jgi:hypothetical protein
VIYPILIAVGLTPTSLAVKLPPPDDVVAEDPPDVVAVEPPDVLAVVVADELPFDELLHAANTTADATPATRAADQRRFMGSLPRRGARAPTSRTR